LRRQAVASAGAAVYVEGRLRKCLKYIGCSKDIKDTKDIKGMYKQGDELIHKVFLSFTTFVSFTSFWGFPFPRE
jgi:hypothetical protein